MPTRNILGELSRYKTGTFAKNKKMLLPALLAIFLVFSLLLPASVARASATTHLPDGRSIISTVSSPSTASAMALNTLQRQATPMVAAGYRHTVGLRSDSTVVAVGENYSGECDVYGWEDIVQQLCAIRQIAQRLRKLRSFDRLVYGDCCRQGVLKTAGVGCYALNFFTTSATFLPKVQAVLIPSSSWDTSPFCLPNAMFQ
jgi:hypothetical protein